MEKDGIGDQRSIQRHVRLAKVDASLETIAEGSQATASCQDLRLDDQFLSLCKSHRNISTRTSQNSVHATKQHFEIRNAAYAFP